MSEGLRQAQDIGSRLLERRREPFPLRFLRFGLQRLARRVLRMAPYLENRAYPSDGPFIVVKNHRGENTMRRRRRRVINAPTRRHTAGGAANRLTQDSRWRAYDGGGTWGGATCST